MKSWVEKEGTHDRRKNNKGRTSQYDNMNNELIKWLPFFIFSFGKEFRKASLEKFAKIVFNEMKDNFPEINKKSPFSKSWATHFIKTNKLQILKTDEYKFPIQFSINGKIYDSKHL